MKKKEKKGYRNPHLLLCQKENASLKPNLPSSFHPTTTSDTESTPTTTSVLFLTADHHLFFVSNRRIYVNAAIFSQYQSEFVVF
jgi:hypothetical protein